MTIDLLSFRETNTFIHPRPKTFFPAHIPNQHHQLKHYISAVDKDVVYFVSSYEIYALHTPTRRRESLATLSFKPSCLGAGYGWVCVGGQNKGPCAFIDLRDARPFAPTQGPTNRGVEVDSLLPLDLDPQSRMFAHEVLSRGNGQGSNPRRSRPKVIHREIGTQIVNSITVHKLSGDSQKYQDEDVAILSNNDNTVHIFSLSRQRVLKAIHFPTHMNHATLSPDGQLLVAVGDMARAFFYRRKLENFPIIGGEPTFAKYDWEKLTDVSLTATIKEDTCFTTEFSPSGHLCAVGSQNGTITLFETAKICEDMDDEDAVIDAFHSSRPCTTSCIDPLGAVRSMAFGPQPWDLFAWAEDKGRFCIADLRDGFKSRQIVHINLGSPDLERSELIPVESFGLAHPLDTEAVASGPRPYRDSQSGTEPHDLYSGFDAAVEFLEEAAENRYRQRTDPNSASEGNAYDISQLNEAERRVLEALRSDYDNQEPIDRFSTNVNNWVASNSASTPATHDEASSSNRNSDRGASRWSRTILPRRRQSIVISNSNDTSTDSTNLTPQTTISASASNNRSVSPQPISSVVRGFWAQRAQQADPSLRHDASTTDSRDDISIHRRIESESNISPPSPIPIPTASTDPWQTISAAMASASASNARANRTQPSSSRPRSTDNSTLTEEILHQILRENHVRHGEATGNRRGRNRETSSFRDQTRAVASLGGDSLASTFSSAARPHSGSANTRDRSGPPVANSNDGTEERRQRERASDAAYRRQRQRSLQAANNEAEAETYLRIERLEALRQVRLRQLSERIAADPTATAASRLGYTFEQMEMLRRSGDPDDVSRRVYSGEAVVQGVQWSGDGRTLFVGTEEGILQFSVNIANRMKFPAAKPI